MTTAVESAFIKAAKGRGYDCAMATVKPFRDMKISWTRSYKWIEFEVSDYLAGMPEDIADDLAIYVLDRIKGDDSQGYPESFRTWLESPEFIDSQRPVFLERFIGFERDSSGRISDAIHYLSDRGLLRIDNVVIGWVDASKPRTSRFFRVVGIPRTEASVKEIARTLYGELCRIEIGCDSDWSRLGYLVDKFEEVSE